MSACGRAAALLALILLAGCGGGSDKREQVESYLQDANAVQKRAAPQLDRANRAYIRFAQQKLTGTDAAEKLAGAEQAIRSTRGELAKLTPPADARTLHRRLLHLYDLDAGMAAETTALAAYLPAAQRSLAPLKRVNKGLSSGLRGTKDPQRQSSELRQFAIGLARITRSLRRLSPPPLLEPTHKLQIARLDRTYALSLRLRSAIEDRDAKQVARVLVRFRKLNERAAPAQGGFRESALRAYDRRYDELRHAAADVERERARLERELS